MDIGLAESLAKALEWGQHEDIKLRPQPLPIPQQELSGAFDGVATRYDVRKFARDQPRRT